MNKRQQRKLMAMFAKDWKRTLVSYGKGRVRKAYMQQYAWWLYYFFKEEGVLPQECDTVSSDGVKRLIVDKAFEIVRHRRSVGKDFGGAKVYIKLKSKTEKEDED